MEYTAPLWSFNFLSKLMRVANCVRFFVRILFAVRYMKVGYLTKKDPDITDHKLQLTSDG